MMVKRCNRVLHHRNTKLWTIHECKKVRVRFFFSFASAFFVTSIRNIPVGRTIYFGRISKEIWERFGSASNKNKTLKTTSLCSVSKKNKKTLNKRRSKNSSKAKDTLRSSTMLHCSGHPQWKNSYLDQKGYSLRFLLP